MRTRSFALSVPETSNCSSSALNFSKPAASAAATLLLDCLMLTTSLILGPIAGAGVVTGVGGNREV